MSDPNDMPEIDRRWQEQPRQPSTRTEPRTAAGRQLVEDEPRLVTGEHDMLTRVLAIEAEAAAPAGLNVDVLTEALIAVLGEDDVLADGSLWKVGEIALNAAPEYARLLRGKR